MCSFPAEPPRLHLAHLPTPVAPLPRLSAALRGPSIDIKRDDLTGVELSGNKVRKLEYVVADALCARATALVTCGGIQSNHARATAAAAARAGLRAHLLLKGEEPREAEGNLFLDRLLGAELRFVTAEQYEDRDRIMAEHAADLRARGERPYVIPEGASNAVGAWGYVNMLRELVAQRPDFPWTHLVCAVGSGGTHAGLLLGSRLLGLDVRVRSYLVQRDAAYFRAQVLAIVAEFGRRYDVRPGLSVEDVDIVSGFEGPAYAEPYPEEIDVIRRLAREEGVILDPVYTGKAFTGLLSEIRAGRYGREDRVLFVHTGGIFGLLAQRAHGQGAMEPFPEGRSAAACTAAPPGDWRTKHSDRFILRWIKLHLSARVTPRLLALAWLRPWMITVTAASLGVLAGVVLAAGRGWLAALCAAAAQILDGVDGQFARLTGRESRGGAFLDSVLDRYADGGLLIGMLVFALRHAGRGHAAILLLVGALALVGSNLVSYTAARGESLGIAPAEKRTLASKGTRMAVMTLAALGSGVWAGLPALALVYLAAHTNVAVVRACIRAARAEPVRTPGGSDG